MYLSLAYDQIYTDLTHFIKVYPKFNKLYRYKDSIRIRLPGFEEKEAKKKTKLKPELKTELQDYIASRDSIRRTKTQISDITICNDFDIFATFTFNCSTCNQNCKNSPCTCDSECKRKNPDHIKKIMSKWLKNQREIHGHYSYIIIPEFHKDGKAIHFHALMKDYKGRLTKTNKTKQGRNIYNIKSYKAGYSTAIKIDNIEKVSSYIKKYISKDMPVFKGRKRYWISNGLTKPIIQLNPTISAEENSTYTQLYEFKNLTVSQNNITLESLIKVGSNNGKYQKHGRHIGRSQYLRKDIGKDLKTVQVYPAKIRRRRGAYAISKRESGAEIH